MTIGAALIAVPFGVGTAIFLAEIAPRWLREILKPMIEILAGLPSVVLGFIGIAVLSSALRESLESADRTFSFHRGFAAGRDLNPDDRLGGGGCPGCGAQGISGWGTGIGRDQVADGLDGDPAGGPVWRADRRDAGDRPFDRRDDDGDDGHRECAGVGRQLGGCSSLRCAQ